MKEGQKLAPFFLALQRVRDFFLLKRSPLSCFLFFAKMKMQKYNFLSKKKSVSCPLYIFATL
jgi:hypothetical protein